MFSSLRQLLTPNRYPLPDRSLDDLKRLARILFVDDREFDVPEILVNSGWRNTKKIDDVESLDSTEILDAHIIFVDISGVGLRLRFADQGLGLISAVKRKHPSKKVVVYSAQRHGDRFHRGLSDADERLPKNADPFQFESLVEKLTKQVFTLSGCIQSIRKHLSPELDSHLSDEEIRRTIERVRSKPDFSPSIVSRAFNIQNAGSIASLISLFLNGS